jgi:peptidyl-prolyl cis-trans isomerase D
MFDFIRKHTRLMQFLLFLLIFPAFALVGIDGYNRFRDKGDVVAMVDGQAIYQPEWDALHKQEVERLRQSMPSLDPKLLDSTQAKYATLERMVRERVVTAAATKAYLTTSDQRLARDLAQNPAIAALRKPDGSLDMQAYKELLGRQNMSPEMFEARVRQDLSMQQVLSSVNDSGLHAKAIAEQSLATFFERREVQILKLAANDFSSKVIPTDAQLEQFHKANPQLFQAPETANIEYLQLDLEAARKLVTLKPEDVKAYYDQNAKRYGGQEERRASHILINAPSSMAVADRAAAKAKAEALLATVKKTPDSFAEIAKKNSQDPGSAANGGDLDFFARGAMVKPFEEAAFNLSKGEISPVVESDFGYHIIQLTDIKGPKAKSFDELRTEVEADLLRDQAKKKFSELAEGFTNAVYEQPDNLQDAAKRLNLSIKTANNLRRTPEPGATGRFANANLLSAIFSPDAIEKKRNTQAIEVAANELISARIVQHTPARALPLAEVKDQVRERVIAQQSAELAKKEGQARQAALQSNPSDTNLPAAVVVSRDQAQGQPLAVMEAVMRAESSKLPAVLGVDLGAQGYAVVRVNKIAPRESAKPTTEQDRQQLSKWWASAESQAYVNRLKQRFKAEIKVAKPAPKDESSASLQ